MRAGTIERAEARTLSVSSAFDAVVSNRLGRRWFTGCMRM